MHGLPPFTPLSLKSGWLMSSGSTYVAQISPSQDLPDTHTTFEKQTKMKEGIAPIVPFDPNGV